MSRTTKWIIGVVVLVLLALAVMRTGMFGGGSQQSAAALNALDASIMQDAFSADGQLRGVDGDLKSIEKTQTQGGIVSAAAHIQAAAGGLTTLATKVQSRLASNPDATTSAAVNTALADMNLNISNATSLAGTATANTKALQTSTSTNAASSSASSAKFIAGLALAKNQLVMAQMALQAARKDMMTIQQLLYPQMKAATTTPARTIRPVVRPAAHPAASSTRN